MLIFCCVNIKIYNIFNNILVKKKEEKKTRGNQFDCVNINKNGKNSKGIEIIKTKIYVLLNVSVKAKEN